MPIAACHPPRRKECTHNMPAERSILLVEDEEALCTQYEAHLKKKGYEVAAHADPLRAIDDFRGRRQQLVVTDIVMEPKDGFYVLEQIKSIEPMTQVIVFTAYQDVEKVLAATRAGAYGFLTKPLNFESLDRMLEAAANEYEAQKRYKEASEKAAAARPRIIGKSDAIIRVFKDVMSVAKKDVEVLITGDTGTGKELVAKAIHDSSERPGRFVPVNCACLQDTTFEAQLYGTCEGAFTGAAESQGAMEQAREGTLFLDEIGDLSPTNQVKMLRVITTSSFSRFGGQKHKGGPDHAEIPVEFRLVCATNRHLEEMVGSGEFREDLFHRLNVVNIRPPSLRQRPEDIPELAQFFLELYAPRLNSGVTGISEEAKDAMIQHHWPGNVRELENSIKAALVTMKGPVVQVRDLRFTQTGSAEGKAPHEDESLGYPERVLLFRQALLEEALKEMAEAGPGSAYEEKKREVRQRLKLERKQWGDQLKQLAERGITGPLDTWRELEAAKGRKRARDE